MERFDFDVSNLLSKGVEGLGIVGGKMTKIVKLKKS